MAMQETTSYKSIFKSTALFGFVQIFNIIIKAATNKIVAIMLGADGIGVMGIFNSSVNMIKTGAGLGISQSAVKDVSEASSNDDKAKMSSTIHIVNKVIVLTAILGALITILLSTTLSNYSFGNNSYAISFIILSVAVGLGIMSEGQLAILKGTRRLRDLAKASMAGSVAGLAVAIPFFKLWGIKGIAPSFIVTAFAALLFSNHYVHKIKVRKTRISIKQILQKSKGMIGMGISLMIISFITYLFDLIVSAYINNNGSMDIVGFYHAGATIVGGYFGIVMTAMITDYYPRVAAISNNQQIQAELNRQAEIGLLIIFPLVVIFIFFAKILVAILYDSSFYPVIDYLDYALLGTIFIVVSNCMDIVLLSKQDAGLYLLSSIIIRVLTLMGSLYLFNILGLVGLGCGRIVMGLLHLVAMWGIMKFKYHISLSWRIVGLSLIVLAFAIISICTKSIAMVNIRYMVSVSVFIASIMISILYLKFFLKIDVIRLVLRHFNSPKK